jgi:hypothetical protein
MGNSLETLVPKNIIPNELSKEEKVTVKVRRRNKARGASLHHREDNNTDTQSASLRRFC